MLFKKTKFSNNKTIRKIVFLWFLVLFFSLNYSHLKADELDDIIDEYCEDVSEDDCEDFKELVGDKESAYDDYDNQLKNAKKLLKLNQEKQQTYSNQINLLTSEITDVQGDINELKTEITTTENKIENILKEIEKKEINIKENQASLSEMLRNYYKINQSLGLTLISNSQKDTLTEAFNQSDYLDKVSEKINSSLKIIKEEKENLQTQREDLEIEKGKLDSQKSDLNKEKQSLSLKKNEKNTLLNATKGEEAEYQNLIKDIEKKMKALLLDVDSLTAEEEGEIEDILNDADKPKEGKASESWYYSQRDGEWRYDTIGGTSLTMGSYGCAVTSVAMVSKYYGEDIEPDDIAKHTSYFSSGSMRWTDSGLLSECDLEMAENDHKDYYDNKIYSISHYTYDEDDIEDILEDLIEDDMPVIVFINGASSGTKGHYVVVHGYDDKNDDFVVHDPYWGANLLLGTSKKIIKSIYGRARVDQIIVYDED